MTKDEFYERVEDFYDLREICEEWGCSVCEYVVDDEERCDRIWDDIRDWYDGWHDLANFLSDIDEGCYDSFYDLYDGDYNNDVTDDFGSYRDDVYEWGYDNGYIDEDDEEENEEGTEEDYANAYPHVYSPTPSQDDPEQSSTDELVDLFTGEDDWLIPAREVVKTINLGVDTVVEETPEELRLDVLPW